MSAQALYRRWRPQSFDDVIGQEHITRTLRNAVAGERLAHAYLFTGPRGTGKTSVARILAKAVNCIGEGEPPCNACHICRAITSGSLLDLVEIDAASNTGVDDVRDLRDKVGFAPNEARYKVYIVDEVHMLSTAAFNALLKTLEEPPEHVIFILATTEPHKIPETILSRCQRHDFRRVSVAEVAAKLAKICEAEGVPADQDALELVARSATGSIRDAESLLDLLLALGEPVTVERVRDAMGTATMDAVVGIVDALADGDAGAGLRWINRALDQGADAQQLQAQLLEHLRAVLLVQTGLDESLLNATVEERAVLQTQAARMPVAFVARALQRVNDIEASVDRAYPGLPLEIAVVELVLDADESDRAGLSPRTAQAAPTAQPTAPKTEVEATVASAPPTAPMAEAGATDASAPPTAPRAEVEATGAPAPRQPAASEPTKGAAGRQQAARHPTTPSAKADVAPSKTARTGKDPRPATDGVPNPPAKHQDAPAPASAGPSPSADLAALVERWPQFLSLVEGRDRNLAALLKDSRPTAADGSAVTVGFFYEFHCRRASEPTRKAVLSEALQSVTGLDRELRCVVVEASPAEQEARPKNRADQATKDDPLIRAAVDELGARVSSVAPHDE